MKWIKCSERLPAYDVDVLTFSKNGIRVASRYKFVYRDGWQWRNTGSDSCRCCSSFCRYITHWIEIETPEPYHEDKRVHQGHSPCRRYYQRD